MLYVQQFQHNRQDHLKDYERLRSAADHNFLLCSNQYAEKLSRSPTSHSIPERTSALLILTREPSCISLHNHSSNDLSILNIRATSWNPQQSRITRENKDYMTALAKGLARPDGRQVTNENAEAFSSRWHHHLTNSVYRPGTGKPGSRGSRPPTAAPERGKTPTSTLIPVNRPTTAPVIIEQRPRRIHTAKVKSAAPTRPPPPPAPLRAPLVFDSSGNFDNLSNATFLQLTEGLKPSIFKSDNNFVHQICSNANETMTEQLNTSHESFLNVSNGTVLAETKTTVEKSPSNETNEDEQEENKNHTFQHVINLGTWQRDAKSGRIEVISNPPSRSIPRDDPNEVERRIAAQEDKQLQERQDEIDRFTFDYRPDSSTPTDEYKSPFTNEYDQAIALQAQLQTTNGNNEWTFKDFYRDVKAKFESGTNTKVVFEKCVKLARLQANTIKWEQRRRQNMNAYNRLIRTNALDTSTSNLTGSFSSKTTMNNNNNEKETRELNELKRELRCGECKRITCLGNCAPGQDYHLYKRIISTIPSQSAPSKPSSLSNGSHLRDQHRCKHGCTTCSASNYRTMTADIINANAIMASLNNNSTNNNNRLRSSKTTYSYGQKSQRPAVDLRPRSMHQVTREMKIKFEQANLSPVVVVPLFENQSQSILNKRGQRTANNGLLPGKSFRSQRRDSLTLISQPKIIS